MGYLHNSEQFPSQSLTFHVYVRWKSMWAGGSLVGLNVDIWPKNSPTQLPTHGQWWSNLAMHRLQTAQCFDLIGFRICGEQAVKVSVLCTAPRWKLQCKSDCWVISLPTLTVFKPRCAEMKTVIITKQVLQNMLRSRLPVSANSTIVWREKKRKQQSIFTFSEENESGAFLCIKHQCCGWLLTGTS